jgi:hypothetical protein
MSTTNSIARVAALTFIAILAGLVGEQAAATARPSDLASLDEELKAVAGQVSAPLRLSDGTQGLPDGIGRSVAISPNGDFAAAGLPGDGENEGSVSVYQRTSGGWVISGVLQHPNPRSGIRFGAEISIDCETEAGKDADCYIAVGAPLDDRGDGRMGSIAVFTRLGASTTWSFEALLVPGTGSATNGCFACALEIDASDVPTPMIVAGVRDAFQDNRGNVLLYTRDNSGDWFLSALDITGIAAGAQLGHSVAIDWPVVVAGAPRGEGATDAPFGVRSGTALTWRALTEDQPPSGPESWRRLEDVEYAENGVRRHFDGAEFGYAVDVRANRSDMTPHDVILIGAPNAPERPDSQDSRGRISGGMFAYRLINQDWQQTANFVVFSEQIDLSISPRLGEDVVLVHRAFRGGRFVRDQDSRHYAFGLAPFADSMDGESECDRCGGVFGVTFTTTRETAIGGQENDTDDIYALRGHTQLELSALAVPSVMLATEVQDYPYIVGAGSSGSTEAAVVGAQMSNHSIGRDIESRTYERPDLLAERIIGSLRLHNQAGGAGDSLGTSVAVTDDYAAVGAPLVSQGGGDAGPEVSRMGRVYLYRRTSPLVWTLQQLLLPDSASERAFARFGTSVAWGRSNSIGDLLFVGAPGIPAVYMFALSEAGRWEEVGRLQLPTPGTAANGKELRSFSRFGASLAATGESVLVGVPDAELGLAGQPAAPEVQSGVAVFYATHNDVPQLLMPERAFVDGAEYGASVALESGKNTRLRAVVGAPGARLTADVWDITQAAQPVREQALVPYQVSNLTSASEFGASVAISEGVIAVGAPGANRGSAAADGGNVYVFRLDNGGWQPNAGAYPASTIGTPAGEGAQWGRSVSMQGDVLLAGGSGVSTVAGRAGASMAFRMDRQDGGLQVTPLYQVPMRGLNAAAGDRFGAAVALSPAGIALVGVPGNDIGVNVDQGSAHSQEDAVLIPAHEDQIYRFLGLPNGQGWSLTWDTNVALCSLVGPGGTDVFGRGQNDTQVSAPGTYTLLCGTAERTVDLILAAPDLDILDFQSSAPSVPRGSIVTLSWRTVGASACALSRTGNQTPVIVPTQMLGGFEQAIDNPTEFILTCSSASGVTQVAAVSVEVDTSSDPFIFEDGFE